VCASVSTGTLHSGWDRLLTSTAILQIASKTTWHFCALITMTNMTVQLAKQEPHSIEVKLFRTELYAAIKLAFGAEVYFGEAPAVVDLVSGYYIRGGEYESAEIKIQRMADGRYHLSGFALWGKGRKYGPHTGQLDFVAEMNNETIEYSRAHPNGNWYRAVLRFSDGRLAVAEENSVGMFGMNVSFSGEYERQHSASHLRTGGRYGVVPFLESGPKSRRHHTCQ